MRFPQLQIFEMFRRNLQHLCGVSITACLIERSVRNRTQSNTNRSSEHNRTHTKVWSVKQNRTFHYRRNGQQSYSVKRAITDGKVVSFPLYIHPLRRNISQQNTRKQRYERDHCVCGTELKISQYADNTTMILDGSKISFTSALLDLRLFCAMSGLRLNNKNETEILLIGALAGRLSQCGIMHKTGKEWHRKSQ